MSANAPEVVSAGGQEAAVKGEGQTSKDINEEKKSIIIQFVCNDVW